jgi:hypothetical protein
MLKPKLLLYFHKKWKKSISPPHLSTGVGLHNPPTYETVYITPELCKMSQITPYNSFEKS